jgi:hypothetical protein
VCDCEVETKPAEENCTFGLTRIETDENGTPNTAVAVQEENNNPGGQSNAVEADKTDVKDNRKKNGALAGIIIGSIIAGCAAVFVLAIIAAAVVVAIVLKRRFRNNSYFVDIHKKSFAGMGNEVMKATSTEFTDSHQVPQDVESDYDDDDLDFDEDDDDNFDDDDDSY